MSARVVLSIEALDRFDVPTAAVGQPLWSAQNWFSVRSSAPIVGLRLELEGDLDGLAIEALRLAYRIDGEPRREGILERGRSCVLEAAALAPAPELTDFDMDVTSFDSLRALGDAVDTRVEETLSVAGVATGLHAHSGTLVLRATSLADATDIATAALRFVVTA